MSGPRSTPMAGQKFEAAYPFVRCTYEDMDSEGVATVQSWRPGVEYVAYGEDSQAVAHGEGKVLLEVIDVHKPGKYPTRVFFTRRWQRPDGLVFGQSKLRITTVPAFMQLTRGWRVGEYELRTPASEEEPSCARMPVAEAAEFDDEDIFV